MSGMERWRRHDVSVVTEVKRGAGVAMFAVLLLAVGALGYGVAAATGQAWASKLSGSW